MESVRWEDLDATVEAEVPSPVCPHEDRIPCTASLIKAPAPGWCVQTFHANFRFVVVRHFLDYRQGLTAEVHRVEDSVPAETDISQTVSITVLGVHRLRVQITVKL